MPRKKSLHIEGVGEVFVTKKRGMRSIRLKINHDNSVAVSAPWFISLTEISKFVRNKSDWINTHRVNDIVEFYSGMRIGKFGKITVVETSNDSSRVYLKPHGIEVRLGVNSETAHIHELIERQVIKYLQQETEEYIFPRALKIAETYGISFNQLTTKKLTGRWGSCDSLNNITINCFLVQLEDELIDYVLVHELSHTQHMNHSTDFWLCVASIMPDYKVRKKRLKEYSPRIYDQAKVTRYNTEHAKN